MQGSSYKVYLPVCTTRGRLLFRPGGFTRLLSCTFARCWESMLSPADTKHSEPRPPAEVANR